MSLYNNFGEESLREVARSTRPPPSYLTLTLTLTRMKMYKSDDQMIKSQSHSHSHSQDILITSKKTFWPPSLFVCSWVSFSLCVLCVFDVAAWASLPTTRFLTSPTSLPHSLYQDHPSNARCWHGWNHVKYLVVHPLNLTVSSQLSDSMDWLTIPQAPSPLN